MRITDAASVALADEKIKAGRSGRADAVAKLGGIAGTVLNRTEHLGFTEAAQAWRTFRDVRVDARAFLIRERTDRVELGGLADMRFSFHCSSPVSASGATRAAQSSTVL